MQIVIEIPNKDIPKLQEIIDIRLHFIDGHIVDAGGYGFAELPKGHGRLIDTDALNFNADYNEPLISKLDFDNAPTIIEADKAESEDEE